MEVSIADIFNSVEGEVSGEVQGRLSTFVRFAGCNLQCSYCDTPESRVGVLTDIEKVIQMVRRCGSKKVTITGGEPLLQRTQLDYLVCNLLMEGFKVSIETNGSFPIPELQHENLTWIVDCKTPDSGMFQKSEIRNFRYLRPTDIIKFVCCSKGDYEFSKNRIKMIRTMEGIDPLFAFSPCYGKLEPKQLLEWMQEDDLFDCLLNLQTHKYAGLK